jgi:hypothetical protein
MTTPPSKKQRVNADQPSLREAGIPLPEEKAWDEWIDSTVFPLASEPRVCLWINTLPHRKTRLYMDKSLLLSMNSPVIETWVNDLKNDIPLTDFSPLVYEVLFRIFLRPFDKHQLTLKALCNDQQVKNNTDVPEQWKPGTDACELLKLSFRLDVPDVVRSLAMELSTTRVHDLKYLLETLVMLRLNAEAKTLAERWIKLSFIPLCKDVDPRPFVWQYPSGRYIPASLEFAYDGPRVKRETVSNVLLKESGDTVRSISSSSLPHTIAAWKKEKRLDLVEIVMDKVFDVMQTDGCYHFMQPCKLGTF